MTSQMYPPTVDHTHTCGNLNYRESATTNKLRELRFKFLHCNILEISNHLGGTHAMFSVLKLMMEGMKLSRSKMLRMDLQSVVGSPRRRQMDSIAILTSRGGWGRERTSTRCCFLIDFTARGTSWRYKCV